jgi:hypothetical protein
MNRNTLTLHHKNKKKPAQTGLAFSINPHSILSTNQKSHKEFKPSFQHSTPVRWIDLIDFDKISLGLDICTSFLLVKHAKRVNSATTAVAASDNARHRNLNAEISKFVCVASIIFLIGQFVSQVEIRLEIVMCENFFFAVWELYEIFRVGQQDDERSGAHIIR